MVEQVFDEQNKQVAPYRETLLGANLLSNYVWSLILLLGGGGFLCAGLSSYLQRKIFFIFDATSLTFIPQGILLVFYGTVALLLSVFIFLSVVDQVGSGYNEFDTKARVVRLFRKGFSLFKNDIFLVYPFSDIQNIELEIVDSINPRRILYLCLKDSRRIPLNPTTILVDLNEIEKRGIFLANTLGVSLILNKV